MIIAEKLYLVMEYLKCILYCSVEVIRKKMHITYLRLLIG